MATVVNYGLHKPKAISGMCVIRLNYYMFIVITNTWKKQTRFQNDCRRHKVVSFKSCLVANILSTCFIKLNSNFTVTWLKKKILSQFFRSCLQKLFSNCLTQIDLKIDYIKFKVFVKKSSSQKSGDLSLKVS